MKSPLMVVLIRVGNSEDSSPYVSRLREILLGISANGVGASRELLQPAELREYSLESINPTVQLSTVDLNFLAVADRVLAVVIDSRPVIQATPADVASVGLALLSLVDRVAAAPSLCVLEVLLKEPGSLYQTDRPEQRSIRLGLKDLDERDLRLSFLTLYTLHNALRLLASGPGTVLVNAPKLFFSHAKRDGVPLTTAAGDWLGRIKGFEKYYDTQDLDLSGDLTAQLSSAVASAIVVVFRSDSFDDRYWCQKEVLWAEQNARPVIIVDARWQIEHSPSVINFDNMPGVRIPDGSVVRIFTAALIEALRVEIFKVRVQRYISDLSAPTVALIPRSPSILALAGACRTLQAMGQNHSVPLIVYPNPSLPQLMLDAANQLANASVPGCRVVSLDELRLLL